MKYLIPITLLLSSCFSANIKNSKNYIQDQTISLESIDTNRDGNLSISEINSFKRQSTSNKSDPFKIFLTLISLVLLISASPYIINSIKSKYVSKNKQKE